MKQDDIVNVIDGSYSFELRNGKLERSSGIKLGRGNYRIIAVGCDLPADNINNAYLRKERNDTILQEITDKTVVFIQERFLVFKHRCGKCPTCGKEIN